MTKQFQDLVLQGGYRALLQLSHSCSGCASLLRVPVADQTDAHELKLCTDIKTVAIQWG
jgi:hypothetical protein